MNRRPLSAPHCAAGAARPGAYCAARSGLCPLDTTLPPAILASPGRKVGAAAQGEFCGAQPWQPTMLIGGSAFGDEDEEFVPIRWPAPPAAAGVQPLTFGERGTSTPPSRSDSNSGPELALRDSTAAPQSAAAGADGSGTDASGGDAATGTEEDSLTSPKRDYMNIKMR